MRRSRRLFVSAAVALGASLAVVAPAQASPRPSPDVPSKVVTAYFADWDVYGRGYDVKDIPADKLNVIQYAFGKPTLRPVNRRGELQRHRPVGRLSSRSTGRATSRSTASRTTPTMRTSTCTAASTS